MATKLFVLDTDILTMLERGDPTVVDNVAKHGPDELAISIVTVEEQLSGWYTQVRQAKTSERIAWAYRQLAATVRFLRHLRILDYDEAAIGRYEGFKRRKLRVRKMDLQIAATALGHDGTMVSRNVRDFKSDSRYHGRGLVEIAAGCQSIKSSVRSRDTSSRRQGMSWHQWAIRHRIASRCPCRRQRRPEKPVHPDARPRRRSPADVRAGWRIAETPRAVCQVPPHRVP